MIHRIWKLPDKWDERFMNLAIHVAKWSKYPGRHVGAVIVNHRKRVVSMVYNGLPNGVDDTKTERYNPDVKYKWAEHAERNAIYNAVAPIRNCHIYTTLFPCMDCARALVQCDISQVISFMPNFGDPDFGLDFKLAIDLFKEAQVYVKYLRRDTIIN
jgi:dCMP deaminase